jgi:hypothetical protein
MESRFSIIEAAKDTVANASFYLREAYGRNETEGPRHILTAALRCIGTDRDIDLTQPYIRVRVKE